MADIGLQLERISKLQAELRRVILDESLAGLEQLVAEKGSRLETVLLEFTDQPGSERGDYRERMEAILAADRELEKLVGQKLKVMGVRLRKTRESKVIAQGYSSQVSRLAAQLNHGTDISG